MVRQAWVESLNLGVNRMRMDVFCGSKLFTNIVQLIETENLVMKFRRCRKYQDHCVPGSISCGCT